MAPSCDSAVGGTLTADLLKLPLGRGCGAGAASVDGRELLAHRGGRSVAQAADTSRWVGRGLAPNRQPAATAAV